jgi:hemoglobin
VDIALLRAIEDPKVRLYPDIKKLDLKLVDAQKRGIRDWISSVTGGPYKYEGKGMKDVHAAMKITDEQFDEFANIIQDVLKKQNVDAAAIKEFMGIVESTRKDIVTVKGKG